MIEEVTRDSIARGWLTITQPRSGYRFNLDSVILAGFASPPDARVCDLGAGSGVVGLWLAKAGAERVVGIEIQAELAALARRNAADNGLDGRYEAVTDDFMLCGLPRGEAPFDQVVSNPPFSPLGRGRLDVVEQRAIARHEKTMNLAGLMAAARRMLRSHGRLNLVHRADRELEVLDAARAEGLEPTRLRRVSPREGRPSSRVLVEARKGDGGAGSGLVVEPPLVLHLEDGGWTPEMARILGD